MYSVGLCECLHAYEARMGACVFLVTNAEATLNQCILNMVMHTVFSLISQSLKYVFPPLCFFCLSCPEMIKCHTCCLFFPTW